MSKTLIKIHDTFYLAHPLGGGSIRVRAVRLDPALGAMVRVTRTIDPDYAVRMGALAGSHVCTEWPEWQTDISWSALHELGAMRCEVRWQGCLALPLGWWLLEGGDSALLVEMTPSMLTQMRSNAAKQPGSNWRAEEISPTSNSVEAWNAFADLLEVAGWHCTGGREPSACAILRLTELDVSPIEPFRDYWA